MPRPRAAALTAMSRLGNISPDMGSTPFTSKARSHLVQSRRSGVAWSSVKLARSVGLTREWRPFKSAGEQTGTITSGNMVTASMPPGRVCGSPQSNPRSKSPLKNSSHSYIAVVKRTWISGNRSLNRLSRGMSQRIERVGGQMIRRSLVATAICRAPTAMDSKALVTIGKNSRPCSVSSIPRGKRRNRLTPNSASNILTCRLTAPWVTQSSSAARMILWWRAAASKARSAFSGGSRMAGTLIPNLGEMGHYHRDLVLWLRISEPSTEKACFVSCKKSAQLKSLQTFTRSLEAPMAIIDRLDDSRWSSSSSQNSRPARRASGLAGPWVEWRRRWRYRNDLKRLLLVGSYMIEDIGLTLEEAREEIAKPSWLA